MIVHAEKSCSRDGARRLREGVRPRFKTEPPVISQGVAGPSSHKQPSALQANNPTLYSIY